MTSSPEDRMEPAEIVSSGPNPGQKSTGDKEDQQRDPEKLQENGIGETAQVDPEVARRIAANVEDFMVSHSAFYPAMEFKRGGSGRFVCGTESYKLQRLVNEANEANARERDMKLSTALKVYPKAIGWSVVLSSCLIVSLSKESVQ